MIIDINVTKPVILSVLLLLVAGCTIEDTNPQQKYTEEHYALSDGTPCVIVKGGSHSGMVGVSCNYQCTIDTPLHRR